MASVPFTADEVEHKTFLTTLRGYDKVEVRAFLRALADDLGRDHGAADGQPESAALLRELRVALEDAVTLRAAAVSDGDAIRRQAERHAAEILADARRNAAELLTAAQRAVS